MKLAILNSFVARCICDPRFLDRLLIDDTREDELLLWGLGKDLAPTLAELERMRQFAGFIAKVQNHDVIALFPQSSQLLRHYGYELSAFVAYSKIHQRLRSTKRLSKSKKIQVLLLFLERFVRGLGHTACPGLGEVLRHETMLWKAEAHLTTFSKLGYTANRVGGEFEVSETFVPRLQGFAEICNYTYNPIEICETLTSDLREWSVPEPNPCSFIYWAAPTTQTVRLFRTNPVATAILSAVDGIRGVAEILAVCEAELFFDREEAIEFIRAGCQSGLLTTDGYVAC